MNIKVDIYLENINNNTYQEMNEKQVMNPKTEDVQFILPLEKPSRAPKKHKKDAASEKEKAKEIILKTIGEQKQVNVLYNPRIEALKIKYESYKVVYSYLQLPQQIKEYYENTYQVFYSLSFKNKKILFDADAKCLIFSDKRKPKPNEPTSQSQQITEDEAYARTLSSGVIYQLEQSLEILQRIRGQRRILLAEHYVTIGKEYLRQCFYNRAKNYFVLAFGVYKELNFEKTEKYAEIHVEFGRLYIQQGEKRDQDGQKKKVALTEYQKCAIQEFKAAQEILSFIKNSNLSEMKANISNSLGKIYFRSDFRKAKNYFLEALSHTQLLDKCSKPCFEAYLNLARLHNSMNRLDDYEQAYRIISEYQKLINYSVYDNKKKNQLFCQLQYACLGTMRYEQGLQIIIKMDNPSNSTIDNILTKWGKALCRINTPISKRQMINLVQTFLRILLQYSELPEKDDRVFAIQSLLQRLNQR